MYNCILFVNKKRITGNRLFTSTTTGFTGNLNFSEEKRNIELNNNLHRKSTYALDQDIGIIFAFFATLIVVDIQEIVRKNRFVLS